MSADDLPEEAFQRVRRQVRALMIISAASRAGIAPLSTSRFHALAYFSNALAPVWNLPALEPELLKRRGGPFYPELQRDLDRLVGTAMVSVHDVKYHRDEQDRWSMVAKYGIVPPLAMPVLTEAIERPEERQNFALILEIALAMSALDPTLLDAALVSDATYADPQNSVDTLIDFSKENASSRAAMNFSDPESPESYSRAEEVHLYIRHLNRLAQKSA